MSFKKHVLNEDKEAIKKGGFKVVYESESKIQKKIIDYLGKVDGYSVKVIKANKSGVADILACVPVVVTSEMVGQTIGAFVALEVKGAKGVVAPLQEHHQKLVGKSAGLASIVRSVDDVKLLLDKLGEHID